MKTTALEVPPSPPPVPSVSSPVEHHQINGTTNHTEHVDEEEKNVHQPKSPLLTSHRISTESLDNINLDEDGIAVKPTSPPIKGRPPVFPRNWQLLSSGSCTRRVETPLATEEGTTSRPLWCFAIHTMVSSPTASTFSSNYQPASCACPNPETDKPFRMALAKHISS